MEKDGRQTLTEKKWFHGDFPDCEAWTGPYDTLDELKSEFQTGYATEADQAVIWLDRHFDIERWFEDMENGDLCEWLNPDGEGLVDLFSDVDEISQLNTAVIEAIRKWHDGLGRKLTSWSFENQSEAVNINLNEDGRLINCVYPDCDCGADEACQAVNGSDWTRDKRNFFSKVEQ